MSTHLPNINKLWSIRQTSPSASPHFACYEFILLVHFIARYMVCSLNTYTSVLVVLSLAIQNWFNSPSKELLATQGLSCTFYSFDSTRNVLHLFKQHYSLKYKIYCSFVSSSCWGISYHLFWKAMTFHNIDYIYLRKVDFDANDNQIFSQLWAFEEWKY